MASIANIGEGAVSNKPVVTKDIAFGDKNPPVPLYGGYTLQLVDVEGGTTYLLQLKGNNFDRPFSVNHLDTKVLTEVPSKDGMLTVRVTNKGTNAEGKREVHIEIEGGKTAMARTTEAGRTFLGKLSNVKNYVPEILTGTAVAGLVALTETLYWTRSSAQFFGVLAVGVVAEGLVVAEGVLQSRKLNGSG